MLKAHCLTTSSFCVHRYATKGLHETLYMLQLGLISYSFFSLFKWLINKWAWAFAAFPNPTCAFSQWSLRQMEICEFKNELLKVSDGLLQNKHIWMWGLLSSFTKQTWRCFFAFPTLCECLLERWTAALLFLIKKTTYN